MKYVSIDIETTGLDENNDQIIEFAAAIDDISDPDLIVPIKNIPKYHSYVTHERLTGNPYALSMHAEILKKLAEPKEYPDDLFNKNEFLTKDFNEWLLTHGFTKDRGGRIFFYAAGKNFAAFDLQFIKKLPYYDRHFNISSMVIDPGPMYVTAKDKKMPDLDTCAKRAGVEMEVNHTALNEVLMVVECVRKKLIPGY